MLSVSLNGEKPTDLFAWRTPEGQILLRVQDLVALGLRAPPSGAAVTLAGEAHLAVTAMKGVVSALDASTLTLALTAQPALLSRVTVIDANSHGDAPAPLRSDSAFVNWAVERAQFASDRELRLSLEGGARLGTALAQASATTSTAADGRRRLVRLMSFANWERTAQQQNWTIGDLWSGASELTPSVMLGGVSVRSLVEDPSRPRYTLGAVQGQVTLPSQVEVYVDGQRVRTERVRPGEFEIRDLNAPAGSRSVE
ncbi:MAG TPA: hypothetical protein VLJ62_15360, partial [Burkholderiaceae bacterium]|nr:hypothetical protein [Burkholderiaceae bacterium]